MTTEQRSTARQRPKSSSSSPQSSRKIFNCIVEDKALIAGAKTSTRNGLRQWVRHGQIRLFVPLHALEQLNLLRKTPDQLQRTIDDVQETLDWLDEATSRYPQSIVLQGGDETFEKWSDVTKFAAPPGLFSEHDDGHDEDNDTPADDDMLSVASTHVAEAATTSTQLTQQSSHEHTDRKLSQTIDNVPETLRPLINYVIWRIHQELDPAAAMDSFIFLCNDPSKAICIRDFQVRCKRLEQLRDAVAREDLEVKARQTMHRPTQSASALNSETSPTTISSQPRSPPKAPAAMLKSQSNIIDPDAFDRSVSINVAAAAAAAAASPPPLVPLTPTGRTKHQSQRSRGGSMKGRGRGAPNPRPAFVDMLFAAGQERAGALVDAGPQIDPNSFERPRGGYTGRGGRKLWSPG